MGENIWLSEVLTSEASGCVNYHCTTCGALPLRTALKRKLNPQLSLTQRDVVERCHYGRRFSHEEGLQLLDQLKRLGTEYLDQAHQLDRRWHWDWHAAMRFVIQICRDAIQVKEDVVVFMQRETQGTARRARFGGHDCPSQLKNG